MSTDHREKGFFRNLLPDQKTGKKGKRSAGMKAKSHTGKRFLPHTKIPLISRNWKYTALGGKGGKNY